MAIREPQPHFVMLPFMAQGHMIPMVDVARLLAERGLQITILTTPHNGNRFKTVINRAINSGLNIQVYHLKFPSAEAGLPEACENFDMLPTMEDSFKFFTACDMLKDQVEELLPQLDPSPSCLIADMCFPWTTNLALKLHIPRLIFHGTSCFSLLCFYMLAISKCAESVTSDFEYFVIPGLPDRIEITRAQFRGIDSHKSPDWTKLWTQMREAEVEAFGIVANTFQELESEYIKEYSKVKAKKVWCIGPVSLCNRDELDKAERGNKASIGGPECLKWLDSQEPGSVVYVCLGSLSRLATSQLTELALGLEASNRPFVWVVTNASDEFQKWLVEEKFEDRTNGTGFLIHGWGPQVLILSHPAVGGFVTHCGWNSTLEGITAGVPMIAWPVLGEQFCNEKFVEIVVRTGIRVGVEMPVFFGQEEKIGTLVNNDEVREVIERLMDWGEEAEERRQRAKEIGQMARRAMEEGGSSYQSMTALIRDVVEQANYGETVVSANDANEENHEKCDVAAA